jgi:hypothetical protein
LAGEVFPADTTLKTYLILQGDPGLNRAPGHNYNVKGLFQLAADTERDAILARGGVVGTPKRVSSVQDFAAQLVGNGPITGGVVYFGHGAGVPYGDGTMGSMLAPGEQDGVNTNITEANVGLLSNAQLAPSAEITLHACYAGYGSGRYSIAQRIANRLPKTVKAPTAGSFFSRDPNSRATGGTAPPLPSPLPKPVYLLQDGGVPFATFRPF